MIIRFPIFRRSYATMIRSGGDCGGRSSSLASSFFPRRSISRTSSVATAAAVTTTITQHWRWLQNNRRLLCASAGSGSGGGKNNKSNSGATELGELPTLLRRVQMGDISVEDAENFITQQRYQDDGDKTQKNEEEANKIDDDLQSFANIDHTRSVRTGFPEVVFGEGKTPQQIAAIVDSMAETINNEYMQQQLKHQQQKLPQDSSTTAILATRVSIEMYEEFRKIRLEHGEATYHEKGRILSVTASSLLAAGGNNNNNNNTTTKDKTMKKNRVVVATAGTTDVPVAEEAALVLEAAGCSVDRVFDVGVAGLHRVIRALPRLRDDRVGCVVVCAGMDGALPSVVGGLVRVPVIAVPTSVGYGMSMNGIAAMLTMLNSCSPGVGVVNVDNGFGAAALAYKIVNQ